MDVTRSPFGTRDGVAVDLFTLANPHGITIRALSLGGIIVSIRVPDRAGRLANVVLGHQSLEAYLEDTGYLGALVGRYANRIAGARFVLEGITYHLTANAGPHHLHGGRRGFDKVVWSAAPFASAGSAGLVLSHISPDGDEGYPGTLRTTVTYTLTAAGELIVDCLATTDKATPVSLTQHSYFNLSGAAAEGFQGHLLQLDADAWLPVDPALIPTGRIAPVSGTPFDFRAPAPIGSRGQSYDHCFVIRREGAGLVHAARVVDPGSGRTLDLYTTEPGLQLYTGNPGGFCLETQQLPDAPNRPGFPSSILWPGSEYRSRTVFAFGTAE